MFRIPLGWLQLKREKLRFAVALAGVGFAVMLILMQLGFRQSLFESSVRYHLNLRYDVVLISPQMSFIAQPQTFSRRRLYQALSVDGVQSVSPVYVSVALWKSPWDSTTRSIFVVGFRPDDDALDVPAVSRQLDLIKLRDTVLFDASSRPEYGPVAERVASGELISAEVNYHEIDVRGLFELGTSFGIDGSLITSDLNFFRIFSEQERGLIQLGLIRLEPGQDPVAARDRLTALLPDDVLVLTRDDYVEREKRYWDLSTPIGAVFGFGVIVGLVVGGIIVYQILFADVSDHMAEYATLKAMGYSDLFLSGVVIQQAVILAVLGYAPATLVCVWLYRTVGEATHLPMYLTTERALGVLALSVAMCVVSALIALRKVRSADPAEIF